jgi:phytoene dehydrogenase-like protein
VLETQDHVGGGVYSDESVEPGFVHDTFSSFYPLAGASPVIKALELEKHGLVWTHAPAVLGNPLPDGSWAMLYRDLDRTVDNLNGLHVGDGDAWRKVADDWPGLRAYVAGAGRHHGRKAVRLRGCPAAAGRQRLAR